MGSVIRPEVSPTAAVRALSASACTIPTDLPEADGTLSWSATTLVLVEVTAEDTTGLGYTYAPAATAALIDDLLTSVVIGGDALAPVSTHEKMVRAIRNAGRSGTAMMALSAVDIALWDLAARLRNLPLARMWGGPIGTVMAYGSGGFTSYDDEQLHSQLERWIEDGHTAVKIKIGESWGTNVSRDLTRVGIARQVVGDTVDLFVDANGAYAPGRAIRVGETLEELAVSWFEEPVSSNDVAGLRRVRDALACDVAAGEYAADASEVAQIAAAVDCVQADVTRCGGYTGWFQAAGVVAGAETDLSVHCAPALSLPAAATTPRVRHLEWFHDHVRIERLLFDGAPQIDSGRLRCSNEHGHGLTLRRATFDKYRSG